MKKSNLFRPILFLISFLMVSTSSKAIVEIYKKNSNIHVSTTRKAVEGYKGCEEKNLQKVTAYIYTLYQKDERQKKGDKSCSQSQVWNKIGSKKSNNSEEIFEDLPDGDYKAIVFIASPIGCDIEGMSQKAIIYLKDKSGVVGFDTKEKTEFKESTKVSDGTIINNDDLEVFPIPTKGKLTIRLNNSKLIASANMVFYDFRGKVILQNKINVGDGKQLEWKIDISSFSSGTYLLRIDDNQGNDYTKKVVVITD